MKHITKIVKGYNYFQKLELFLRDNLTAFSTSLNNYNIFNTVLIFTPNVVIVCKKCSQGGQGRWIYYIPIDVQYSNKLGYLQLQFYNSFGLWKQSSQKLLKKLIKLLEKTSKRTCEWILFELVTLQELVFSSIFLGFFLEISEDFFHRRPPSIFVVIVNRLWTVF